MSNYQIGKKNLKLWQATQGFHNVEDFTCGASIPVLSIYGYNNKNIVIENFSNYDLEEVESLLLNLQQYIVTKSNKTWAILESFIYSPCDNKCINEKDYTLQNDNTNKTYCKNSYWRGVNQLREQIIAYLLYGIELCFDYIEVDYKTQGMAKAVVKSIYKNDRAVLDDVLNELNIKGNPKLLTKKIEQIIFDYDSKRFNNQNEYQRV